jgi:hypothetical protein
MKKLILLFIAASITFIACKKETDSDNPVVAITSPTENQPIATGDSALVAFTITDADTHGFDFRIINTTTGDTLFLEDEHSHENVTFSKKYKMPDVSMQLRLILTGEDHNGNTTTKTVNFYTTS